MEETNLHFIDVARVDDSTRRLIRSHVMRGRNVGKNFHRRSRLELAKRPTDINTRKLWPRRADTACTSEQEPPVSHQKDLDKAPIARNVGDAFLSLMYPFELTGHSLRIINLFFEYAAEKTTHYQLGFAPCDTKRHWAGILFVDEAATHCALALMESYLDFFFSDTYSSSETLQHLSMTFALVNQRLASGQAVSDSTLAIVVMLIQLAQLRDEHPHIDVHFKGLWQMVALRGGLCEMESNPALMLKICKADIMYSLRHGGSLRFFRDRMTEVKDKLESMNLTLNWSSHYSDKVLRNGLSPELTNILQDVMAMSAFFDKFAGDRKVDTVIFTEMVVSICSRLIRFHTLGDSQPLSGITEAAYHIGLVIFMMTMFMQYDSRRFSGYGLVSSKLRDALDHGAGKLDKSLILWLMFIGAIWNLGHVDDYWIFPLIKSLCVQLGIVSFTGVQDHLRQFPWIKVLHDDLGKIVWNMAHQ